MLNGFLLVHKPFGPTSFDVVRHVQRCLGIKKIGHAGTLDPAASGLLVIAVGAATRMLEILPTEPKTYDFGIRFGSETDTLDSEGAVVRNGGRIPLEVELEAALKQFLGTMMQMPPRYSAKKIQGKRAYDLARSNIEFTLQPREITIEQLELKHFDIQTGEAVCTVCCSTGTYVRSLVRDIALYLTIFAYASFIHRSTVGPFMLKDAIPLSALDASFAVQQLIPVKTMFVSVPAVIVNGQQCDLLSHGMSIPLSMEFQELPMLIAYDEKGEVAAVLKKDCNGLFHPDKVFLLQEPNTPQ